EDSAPGFAIALQRKRQFEQQEHEGIDHEN
ncbi:MAG: hypothetical protein QOJ59_1851, partial [Thermomicrobiales bacterium]|nr:hypothetical protein [Thermomicrobiales bacterium]